MGIICFPVTIGWTGESLGLLVEAARTNLLVRSEELNTTWSQLRSSVSVDQIVAPDGTVTADKIVEDNTNNTHLVEQVPSYTSGTVYTYSAFIKAAERDSVMLQFGGAAFPANPYARFDLSDGSLILLGSGADSYDIQPFPGGWYRLSVTATADATSTAGSGIFVMNGTSTSYLGDGSSGLYAWGNRGRFG